MTVSELIEHLKQFPGDMIVVQQMFSETSEMDAKDVKVSKMFRRGQSFIHFQPSWMPVVNHEIIYEIIYEVLEFPGN